MDPNIQNHYEEDARARIQALDTQRSWIVQAPAGSGKTELLIQRYLALLGVVPRAPEQVLAMTFTQKAAHEMRERVLKALEDARQAVPLQADHQRVTRDLARRVLERNDQLQWSLWEQPDRMQIMTFDAFCMRLCQQAHHDVATYELLDDPEPYYLKALDMVLDAYAHHPMMISCLRLFEHDLGRLKQACVSLLARRDQWIEEIMGIRHEHDQPAAHFLEQSILAQIQTQAISRMQQLAASLQESPIGGIWEVAQAYLGGAVVAWASLWADPAEASTVESWQAFLAWLLTRQGTVKKRWTEKEGILAPSKIKDPDIKAYWQALKAELVACSEPWACLPGWQVACDEVLGLPARAWEAHELPLLEGMVSLMVHVYAALRERFRSYRVCDFSEIARSAYELLFEEGYASDFALSLDHRLEHLLVDEFQDTSLQQHRLLTTLTQHWTPGDGHTFFAVGDPMQSIYRFRQAQVHLFLQVQQQGLGDFPVQALFLRCNFRSSQVIVDHINQRFGQLMPDQAHLNHGAVPYVACAHRRDRASGQVREHWLSGADAASQSRYVAELAGQLRSDGQRKVAILLRSRAQLGTLIDALDQHTLPYQIHGLKSLYDELIIQDTLSMILAMMTPQHPHHWLAFYRSMWMGMTLKECYELMRLTPSLSDLMLRPEAWRDQLAHWDAGLWQRIDHASRAFQHVWSQSLSMTWFEQCQSLWQQMHGSRVLSPDDHEHLLVFWRLLSRCDAHYGDAAYQYLERRLRKAPCDVRCESPGAIDVMSIHQAKGLEFDAVILPGLEKPTPAMERPLLWWGYWLDEASQPHWLMCPQPQVPGDTHATAQYMRRMEQTRMNHERLRLWYVAATRARDELHWVGSLPQGHQDVSEVRPRAGSAMADLWPSVCPQTETVPVEASTQEVSCRHVMLPVWECPEV